MMAGEKYDFAAQLREAVSRRAAPFDLGERPIGIQWEDPEGWIRVHYYDIARMIGDGSNVSSVLRTGHYTGMWYWLLLEDRAGTIVIVPPGDLRLLIEAVKSLQIINDDADSRAL